MPTLEGAPNTTTPPPHPTALQGRPGAGVYLHHLPTRSMGPMGWGAQGIRGYHSLPPPAMGLEALGLSYASTHVLAAALKAVVVAGVVAALPSPL